MLWCPQYNLSPRFEMIMGLFKKYNLAIGTGAIVVIVPISVVTTIMGIHAPFLIIWVLFIIATCIYIYRENKASAERAESYLLWASLNGWSYGGYNGDYDKHYPSLQILQQGSERSAFNIVSKNWNSYNAEAFNYHYETYTKSSDEDSSTKTEHHYLGVVLIETNHSFSPDLSICSCLCSFGASRPIVFESIEFTNTFTVTCEDRRFAYDFCHPRMMNYLLNSRSQKFRNSGTVRVTEYFSENRNILLQVHKNLMVMYKIGSVMDVDEVEDYFIKLHDIRQLMPDFLFVS